MGIQWKQGTKINRLMNDFEDQEQIKGVGKKVNAVRRVAVFT